MLFNTFPREEETMDFSKTLLLIVSLSSLLLANAVPLTRSPQFRLYKLCKPTTNPALCFKTILPQIRGPFNPYKALEAEILATQNQVKKTAGVIAGLLANPHNSKELSDSLSTCRNLYGDILDSINESIRVVALRNVIEARFKFSAVLSFHSTCNEEFTGGPSPFANESNTIFQLGGNCLDLMKAIEDRATRHKSVRNPAPAVPSPPDPCEHVIGTCDS